MNKTYDEMKIYLHEERQSLEVVRALMVEDSLNQVHII